MKDGEMERLQEAVGAISALGGRAPRVGIVLGTGLGGLADAIDVQVSVAYRDLPHFPVSTVESHQSRLLLGTLEGVPVVAMQGRFHRYEGYSLQQIVFPIRVMRLLGADTLIVSAACGGMNPLWGPGDLMVLDDFINLMGSSPLVGPNLDELGPRFPDMSAPFDAGLQEVALKVAMAAGMPLRRGVYVAVVGPQLETRAEYRMLRAMGADVVGMSTVPEVIAARHMGMRVLAFSIITDQCLPDALEEADVPTIIATAQAAEPKLTTLVTGVLQEIGAGNSP
ncbi:MAG: purine-nucleoside phosphorylase [Gemmatimonadota bacterium]|nr:purine-nucleoside phosphorylase [Gemmatimonadota bacterium]